MIQILHAWERFRTRLCVAIRRSIGHERLPPNGFAAHNCCMHSHWLVRGVQRTPLLRSRRSGRKAPTMVTTEVQQEPPAYLTRVFQLSGSGYVADVAGGLKHATELSWRSPVRLCILFANAPCHGTIYHDFPDAYPKGCPAGVDPARMICNLQVSCADAGSIRQRQTTSHSVNAFYPKRPTGTTICRKTNQKGKRCKFEGG